MACCALWVRPGCHAADAGDVADRRWCSAVTPVAVAPPLPPAGVRLPLAPQGAAADVPAPGGGRRRRRRRPPCWARWRHDRPSRACHPTRGLLAPPPLPLLLQGAVVVVVVLAVVVVVALVRAGLGRGRGAAGAGARRRRPARRRGASATVVVVSPPAPSAWPFPPAEPRARAAWLPSRRDPQAEARSATMTTESATAMCWRDGRRRRGAGARRRRRVGAGPGLTRRTRPCRTGGSRPGCAECARAGRRSGRWPARCAGPPRPGACSRRCARRCRHR